MNNNHRINNLDDIILNYLNDDSIPYNTIEDLISLRYDELVSNIEQGKFKNYEYMLPIIMMFSKSHLLSISWKIFSLELYSRAIDQIGQNELEHLVLEILKDEEQNISNLTSSNKFEV